MNKDLIAVSIDLLFDGMVVPHDIYDADAKILLIGEGHTLRLSQIDAIRRFNKDRDTIQVSEKTHQLMMEKANPVKESYLEKIEKETGYGELKDETLAIINEIGITNTAPHEKIHTISHELSNHIEKTDPDLILDIINALAPVDEYLQRHSMNVSLLNGLIGRWLGLPKETVDTLIQTGLVHDCGKMSIPLQILNAPRKLSATEFEVIKMHPVYGYEMLSEFPDAIRFGVLSHHEKFNSKGYPEGLSGENIPLEARITAVSDIYDAMVSQRAYKNPRNPFAIIAWIKSLRGTELEQSIVDVFTENMPKEMINKSVLLSDGSVGKIHKLDDNDLEYPFIQIGDEVFKSSKKLFCTQMTYE